ncbi:hypothetical protein [Stakelama marina]|uniref:Uncharacterized protein n=1 Tax=Stakelama marina TaxID=2826939 RepID=A0A8T4IF56_9SPHN|nr:hypothetical protein [Stakelama marina]MBR0551675.1 hypothetical protein [Stakelama marina]
MQAEISAAIIGFGAAILGGSLQSAVSWFQSHRQFERESRQRDYELFVEAVAQMSQAPMDSPERKVAVAKSIEGKARILLNGSLNVVRALEKQSRHAVLSDETSFEDFCALVEAMRKDVGGKSSQCFRRKARSVLFEQREA